MGASHKMKMAGMYCGGTTGGTLSHSAVQQHAQHESYGVTLPVNMSSFFVPRRESVHDKRIVPRESTAIPA